MLRFSIAVQSLTVTPEEVSRVVQVEPDRVQHVGDPLRVPGRTAQWHVWEKILHGPAGSHPGTEGMSRAIEALGMPLAERFGALAARGADVMLEAVQEMEGELDTESTGISLSPGAIAWLAAAGAEFGIDQYFYVEGDDD